MPTASDDDICTPSPPYQDHVPSPPNDYNMYTPLNSPTSEELNIQLPSTECNMYSPSTPINADMYTPSPSDAYDRTLLPLDDHLNMYTPSPPNDHNMYTPSPPNDHNMYTPSPPNDHNMYTPSPPDAYDCNMYTLLPIDDYCNTPDDCNICTPSPPSGDMHTCSPYEDNLFTVYPALQQTDHDQYTPSPPPCDN